MAQDSSAQNQEKSDTRSGKEPAAERFLDRYLGNSVHLFLSLLAILILIAAAIATVEIVIRDFPLLWQQANEYDAMHRIIQDILLVAIAAELALLLLFHRTSAASEVLIFVIARKMVTPGISGLELLLGAAALAGLIIVRFYYLTGRQDNEVVARS
ncbi:MAG TPA: hypothetical protein VFI57_10300 [Pyrinomonadaceae bacterium]|jgi:hypothetical protein|nr:hypothetical protein [Pyrinomonadaceae bacterium]